DLQLLPGISVSAHNSAGIKPVHIGIEVKGVRRRANLSTAEQNFQHFSSSTKFAAHWRRRPFFGMQIDVARIHQVMAMGQRRSQTDQELNRLNKIRIGFLPIKILLERHLSRQEVQQRGPHTQWPGSYSRNALLITRLENNRANLESEIIEAVDVNVYATQELVDVFCGDSLWKALDAQLRIDAQRGLFHHIELW